MSHLPSISVIFCFINVQQSGQPKICNLHMIWALHQDIPGSQVPVNQTDILQVAHALKEKQKLFGFFGQGEILMDLLKIMHSYWH